MSFVYAAAWITPLLLGTGVVAALAGRPRTPAAYSATLGGGFVLGALLCALAVGTLGRVDVDRVVPVLSPMLLALGIAVWAWVLMRPRATAVIARDEGRLHPLLWILLALLGVHAILMADEILLRPMYPWDAWAAGC